MIHARDSRAMTLIEILVVIAIMGVVTGGIIAGSHQMPSAKLKRSATLVAAAVKFAFSRASSVSRPERIVFDLDDGALWLEEAETTLFVKKNDTTGTGGAEAATDAERAAVEEALRASDSFVNGPTAPRPRFKKIDALVGREESDKKGIRVLPSGIVFRQVSTPHDLTPATKGRGYLYFWPEGMTERAVIELQIKGEPGEHSTMSVQVSPLTGHVRVRSGAFDLPTAGPDSLSEREDPGW